MRRIAGQLLLGAAGAMLASSVMAQNANSIGVSGIVNPIAAGFAVEYERLLGRSASVGLRYASFSYDYKDDPYREKGDVKGFDVTGRYYFSGEGMKKLYLGAAIGRYKSDWDWTEPGSIPASGSGSTNSWHYGGMVGYKHHFTSNFFIDGFAAVGTWAGSGKDSTGTKESELGAYVAVGAGLGFQF
jgi:hypothetical protein